MLIDREQEEFVRNCEYQVNAMLRSFRSDFPDKTMKELLAMAAFQYAKAYNTMTNKFARQESMLKDFESKLDELLQLNARTDSLLSGLNPDSSTENSGN